jgi:molybdopterin-binding protein
MNTYQGNISQIQTSEQLSIVTVQIGAQTLKAIVIDTPETVSYMKINETIQVLFKESEVIISTDRQPNISLQNKISGTILSMKMGTLLSRLVIQTAIGQVVSVISTNAITELGLKEKQPVTAMIKINEVILAP